DRQLGRVLALHNLRHRRPHRATADPADLPARRAELASRAAFVQAHQPDPAPAQWRPAVCLAEPARPVAGGRAPALPPCRAAWRGAVAAASPAGFHHALHRAARGDAARHLRAGRPADLAAWPGSTGRRQPPSRVAVERARPGRLHAAGRAGQGQRRAAAVLRPADRVHRAGTSIAAAEGKARRVHRACLLIFAIIPALAILIYLAWIGVTGVITGGPALRPWTYAQRLLTEPRVLFDYLQ